MYDTLKIYTICYQCSQLRPFQGQMRKKTKIIQNLEKGLMESMEKS